MSTIAQTPPAHEQIDRLAARYAMLRDRVKTIVDEIEDGIRAVHRQHRRALHEALATAEGAQAALLSALREHPELFDKPKSWSLHGLRVGFRKGSGKVEWELADEELITRLRKRLGEDSEEFLACVETVEKLRRDGLRELDAKVLAACGVTIEDVAEVPFIKAVEGETDKLVKRLLKEATGRITEES